MAEASPPGRPPTPATVRLEVRAGGARPTAYEVGDGGFLVGSVPGCDLRLPGTDLAPVLCLITRHAGGASVRKLVPVQPLLVNGRAVTAVALNDGDRIAVGGADIGVRIELPPGVPLGQAEIGQAAQQLEEAQALRRELAEVRRQLHERYRSRRDRLAAQQQAIRRAARRFQERKRRLDAAEAEVAAQREQFARRQAEIEGHAVQAARERELLDEQHRLLASRQQELQRDLAERAADVLRRERALATAEQALEKGQKQHQADLVRLDRIQALIEQRTKRLQAHALEVDRRYEQLQRDTRELEEQAGQLDAWHNRLVQEAERLAAEKKARDGVVAQLDQRAAALEGQQAMLATLRTRIERLREELHRQEQALGDQRALQEAGEQDLRQRTEEARRLRVELDNDRALFAEERRRFDERRATLEAAVAQLRQAQESFAAQEAEVRQRQEQVEATAAAQAEQVALLTARAGQLDEQQARVAADREALREREAALARAEQALAALQEQVRRRSEELADKLREHTETAQRVRDEAAQLEARRRTAEEDERLALERLDLVRQEVAGRAAEVEAQAKALAEREETLRQETQRLEEAQRALAGQRQVLAGERLAWEVEKQRTQDEAARRQEEWTAAQAAAQEMARKVPELEARAAAALERLVQARAQLRDSLAEMHTYARQGRDDLEAARRQVQAETERLRQQELELQVARDEHRLAVAAFRQQLIEWQGQVGEMRQALAQSETQLGRRQAEVEARAQEVADASARLALQAEQLEQEERRVAERRGEVDRHLADMREWYRRKLRELAGLEPSGTDTENGPADGRGILALTGDVEPGDRQLGDLLRSLELIDADTLAALLLEARRQRRSLRQVLLAGGYLTLYQMALIEAGNLDGLVLGPVRVIDRLQATPREAVYRVFDPRRNAEALLRHLAESEMEDAVRPDEFRQRFAAAAAVQHPHLAATLEVLEIAGRPAALQEWLGGVPSTEWPALVAAPGVWFRLLSQAALALHTAHAAGLVHGHLHAASFVFTPEGVLKLCGLGEPRWLAVPPPQEEAEPSTAGDLEALGHIAAGWANGSGRGKPLPAPLQEVLRRLSAAGPDAYASARDLLDDLDRAGAAVPANAAAWERFVRQVREESAESVLRQSA